MNRSEKWGKKYTSRGLKWRANGTLEQLKRQLESIIRMQKHTETSQKNKKLPILVVKVSKLEEIVVQFQVFQKRIPKTVNFLQHLSVTPRVSVQGVKSLGGHFACLCRRFEFYEVRKIVIIFQKENGNTFTLLIIFIVKSLQKEQNSTNLLL